MTKLTNPKTNNDLSRHVIYLSNNLSRFFDEFLLYEENFANTALVDL